MKNTEIIGDVKKSIVCDSVEIISTVREVFFLTVETDRSPPVTQCTIFILKTTQNVLLMLVLLKY